MQSGEMHLNELITAHLQVITKPQAPSIASFALVN